jgi:hypothetical protein
MVLKHAKHEVTVVQMKLGFSFKVPSFSDLFLSIHQELELVSISKVGEQLKTSNIYFWSS